MKVKKAELRSETTPRKGPKAAEITGRMKYNGTGTDFTAFKGKKYSSTKRGK